MINGSIFFQHPIGLWDAEPYKTARRDLGPYAEAVYWRVFECIRLHGGRADLDQVKTLFDDVRKSRDRDRWKGRLQKILRSEYNLFDVSQQRIVTIIDHTKAIREANKRALEGPSLFDGMDGWESLT